jgi:transcription elongation factor Elf1
MKTCTRCKQIKPNESFTLNKNYARNSHCKACQQAINREWKHHNRQEYNAYRRAIDEVRKGQNADPAKYTSNVCQRIAGVTQRAITRWEERTNQEAPPHLTAILQLAQQLAVEQQQNITPPPPTHHTTTCFVCLTQYTTTMPHSRYCSDKCKQRAKKIRRDPNPAEPSPRTTQADRELSKRQQLQPIRDAQAAYRDIESALIRLYRAHGVKWQTIANTFDGPNGNPGNVYGRAYQTWKR